MSRTVLLTLICLTSFSVSSGTLYQWVDENGVTHFSDAPQNTDNGSYPVQDETIPDSPQVPVSEPAPSNYSLAADWQDCDSRLCSKVRQLDPDCRSSDCVKAKQYTYEECESIICRAERMEFVDRIDRALARNTDKEQGNRKADIARQQRADNKERDKALVEKCIRDRDVFCDKGADHIREEYERQRLMQGLK
jgi:hypothetical protein